MEAVVKVLLLAICCVTWCTDVYLQAAAATTTPNCPAGYTDVGGYCYNYTGVSLSWTDAKAFCTKNNGHLMVEATSEEHIVFVTYRQTLPTQGDPMWEGVYADKPGHWQWLVDDGLTNPLYTNWGGKIPSAPADTCIATTEVNMTQLWQAWKCATPLYFLCEAYSKYPPSGGYTYNASRYLHNWKKIYPDSIYNRTTFVANANMARTRTLTSCAVTCSTISGCAAFNHRPIDNTCQFILTKVPDKTYVVDQTGWDVWVDFPPPA